MNGFASISNSSPASVVNPSLNDKRRGAEEMDVNVARAAELRIFELVPFEVGEAVAHVRLAREERLFPDDGAVAPDAAHAFDMLGRRTDEQLGAERRLPKLRMGEPQIILALGDMVAELVGEAKAEPVRRAVGTDQIDASELRFLAAVLRRRPAGQRLAGRDQLRAVALVEPFGLAAGLAFRRLAALDAFEEHPHRIGLLLRRSQCGASGRARRPTRDASGPCRT